MGIIYKISNSVNDKVYIGKTQRTLQVRWTEHKNKYIVYDNKLYRAMRKYGIEKFKIDLVEENIPVELLNQKEKDYINQYNSYYNGYNSTFGGEGESSVDFSKIEKLYLKGMNCTQIERELGYTRKTISSLLKANGYEIKKEPGNKGKGKEVVFEGKIYSSLTSLAEYLVENNKDFTGKKVSTVVQGISSSIKNNTSYLGYTF